ncbi:MAG: conjugative relaxase, partial [Proteobacteria bacterium]|nr:conjugative relaxase [Pseudomonadota bacterium]
MMSAAKLTTANGSIHDYYSADDYYSQESTILEGDSQLKDNLLATNRAPSLWHGKLARDFDLKGAVDKDTMDKLTHGILPDGTQMQGRINEDGEKVNDPGRDLTLSAPKSFSILTEVLGIEELKKLDENAVKQTLDHIEENYSYTRVKINGKVHKQLTKNLLFATYTHNTSRNLDPNRHTHCIALNVTKKEDGSYRTVHYDPIFDDYKHLGLIYRSNLAYNLQKEGYAIEVTNQEHGFFEIRGFPKEIIDKFSSRRREIEEQANKLGVNSAKAKQIAALLTRDQKVDVANHILKEDWNNTLKQEIKKLDKSIDTEKIDISNLDQIFRSSLHKNWNQSITDKAKEKLANLFVKAPKADQNYISRPSSEAKSSIQKAIKTLCERNSIFTEKDLREAALKDSLGKSTLEHIDKEIVRLKNNKSLIITAEIGHKNHLGSKTSLREELKIIDIAKESLKHNNYKPAIFEKEELKTTLSSNHNFKYHNLTEGQKKAIDLILTTKNPTIAIQGYAGTGKTTMLKAASELMAIKNKSFFGLAPQGSALIELQSIGIKSQTLQSFLQEYTGVAEGRGTQKFITKKQEEFKDKIIIVDEASQIGNKQMIYFNNIANRFDVKSSLMGDSKQLGAVEAGNPFYQMQKHGLKTAIMGDIVRQKNTRLKSAVYDVINASNPININKGYIKQAFSKIDNIIEVKLDEKEIQEDKKYTRVSNKDHLQKLKNKDDLMAKIAHKTASNYCQLSPEQRNNTLLLTISNKSRIRINNEIRKQLKKSGELVKSSVVTKEVLINKALQDELKRNINSYDKGDILRFNKALKSAAGKIEIMRDKYYQVFEKDVKNNHIYLTELKENNKKASSIKDKIASLFTPTNKTVIFDPNKMGSRKSSVEVYNKEQKEFLIGEKINFTRGFISKGITNSMSGVITDVSDNSVTIKTANKEITLKNTDSPIKHIDYGYAFTANRAQGMTVDNVMAVLESYHSQLTSQKPFYVEISRARNNVTLIMDDKKKVIDRLEKETGEKVSIIEAIKHKEDIVKRAATRTDKLNHNLVKTPYSKKTDDKAIEKTKYLIPEFPDHEVQERFKEAINENLINSDLKNLD